MSEAELRDNISLIDLFEMFPDDATAEKWFVKARWPDRIKCAYCDGGNIDAEAMHPSMPYFCNNCRKYFSAKTNTVMHRSKLGYQKWAIAIYLMTSRPKGISSMELHRAIGVTQKTAWHMGHRIREAYKTKHERFSGEVEVDETFVGGLEKNKHAKNKLRAGRGTVGKIPVVGLLERDTKHVMTRVVPDTDARTLQPIVLAHTEGNALVYTDDAYAYRTLRRRGNSVRHGVGEYVKKHAPHIHINGIESFWSIFKRAYKGTFHKLSPKHLQRYFDEFAGRHNSRSLDTRHQMVKIVQGGVGKRLTYDDLVNYGE